MPRTTNRGVSNHVHLLEDIPALDTLNGVQSFTYAPGTTTDGQSFGTWAELYAAYTQARAERPYVFREIVFDPRGLPAGTPLPIPAISGVPVQSFEAQTVFTSKGNPSNRIPVEFAADVSFDFIPDLSDPGAPAQFSISGLDAYMAGGAANPLGVIPATRKLKIAAKNASLSTKSAVELFNILDGDFELDMVDAEMPKDTGPVIKMSGTGRSLVLSVGGLSSFGKQVIQSDFDLASIDSSLSTDTRPAPQDIRVPTGAALFAPAANANVRPAYSLTVLTRGQLALAAPNNTPQILQGFPFQLSGGVPVAGNTFKLGSGVAADTETYTFVAAAVNPFEVTIGLTALATMLNLISTITADSVLWQADLIKIPGGGIEAIAIYRKTQTKEGLSYRLQDKAWGTIAAAANPVVGVYPNPTTGEVLLSYSRPTIQALPNAEPDGAMAGWSTVSGLTDKAFVTVIDEFRSGTYQASNPAAAGSGSWRYVMDAADPTLVITGAGTYFVQRQTRFVLVTLGALDVANLVLSPFFDTAETVRIFRTDNTAGTLNLVTVSPDTSVNNVASPVPFAGGAAGHGAVLQRDGIGGWWTPGVFP